MPRVVLDTNVLVSALITPEGASAQLILALRGGAFEVVVSPLLLVELGDVLRRSKFRQYVSETEIASYIEAIRREAVLVEDPGPSVDQIGPDPDDEYLIDLARAVGVDALVSGDAHLLGLRGVLPVMSPREFLESLVGP